MARKILVTSGKGGVGKTSVCAHLGYALSSVGERVAVFDLDFGLNNLDVVMGVESKVVYDIKDVLDGKCRVKQTIIECTPRLALIPSRHTFDGQVTGQNIKLLAEGVSSRFDYLFYDCPAGVEGGFHRAACAADEAILVVTPTITSLRDGDKVLSLLKKLQAEKRLRNRKQGAWRFAAIRQDRQRKRDRIGFKNPRYRLYPRRRQGYAVKRLYFGKRARKKCFQAYRKGATAWAGQAF